MESYFSLCIAGKKEELYSSAEALSILLPLPENYG
jgi:hypothetical protein